MTCSLDITNEAKLALDQSYALLAQLGLHPYDITVIVITNTDGYRPGVGGTKEVSEFRLTVGPDGYDPVDGYYNPDFTQVSAKDIVLSGARLTDSSYCIGPLVPPYVSSCGDQPVMGGTDPRLLNPLVTTPRTNLQLYFRVEGPGMAEGGSYFRRIYSKEDSKLTYRVYVEHSGEVPNLNV